MTTMTLLGAFDIITPDPGLFIWTVLVFLILLWLLNKFAFGPIKDALKNVKKVFLMHYIRRKST